MKLFFDTSSLFKLYHQEEGTKELESIFLEESISHIYLSEITKIEFASTIWKKVRTNEITIQQAENTLILFESDFGKYNFIFIDSIITEQARNLMTKYGIDGLRTLDSIQLSTCVLLAKHVDYFLTADKLLKKFVEREGLKTEILE
ncbi:MAG: type II toxin-antitoxin system VapC family toxin [Spirosomaceae bacterium]|nr:type II toxin-antitoxin system VapC family toxin [Spirosomataceae bacterium]